ncbi:MAG: aspartate aminotransferase family protein [Candidatus Aminicenantes bacterium]|nr:aspartate aminotransferase family protein [Candidatus Aminicenantes bacterium]
MDNKTFRKFGHEFIDWAAEYFEHLRDYPVCPSIQPGRILQQLPENPPEEHEDMGKIFHDFKEIILPGMTHWQHPGWFGYFPANNSPPSILAEILTAGMGAQCMVWQTSPAAAELEERVLGWLRQMIGLPEGMAGVIQDSASTATLCALLSAREKATGYSSNLEGIKTPLTVYASEETHSGIEKGVKIAGFGKNFLRKIETDDSFAMVPEKLEEAVVRDKEKGLKAVCVVATLGTTSSTAVDPLRPIGEICSRYGIWLHVDAAFAGTAALLPEKRDMLDGIEYVDSFVFNPHKWMLTNFDCSAYFVKDEGALIRTFEIHPEYLKTSVDKQVKNYRDWGIQLGRRFRALKLWFVIRSYGVEGIRSMVREHIRLAKLFEKWVIDHEVFELMAPVPLSLVCFRFNDGRKEEDLDQANKRLLISVNKTGEVFLTHTTLKGKYVLRLAVGSRTTREEHVRKAWELIVSRAKGIQSDS